MSRGSGKAVGEREQPVQRGREEPAEVRADHLAADLEVVVASQLFAERVVVADLHRRWIVCCGVFRFAP